MTNFGRFACDKHASVNHLYGDYLPYRFHLELIVSTIKKFEQIWYELYPDKSINLAIDAGWGHDLIEDTRMTFNDVLTALNHFHLPKDSEFIAEIIYSLTNEKGRNRAERGNDRYYEGIRNTEGGIFIKLADRIGNVKFSSMTGSRMQTMYSNENNKFLHSLGLTNPDGKYPIDAIPETYHPMIMELDKYLNI